METITSDLTVAGGGIAGICAALAAARHGMHVTLINDRPVLGGNASSEVAVSISGAASGGNSRSVYAREGGIVEEIKLTRLHYNQTAQVSHSYQDWPMEDAAYFDLIYNEKNIDLYLNTSVRGTEVDNGVIKAVTAVQLGSEREFRFESPLFVDATGDGTVGYNAGALYKWGEEAAHEFKESLAPEDSTRCVMGSTILLFTRDAGKKVTYKRPTFAYDVTKLDYFDTVGKKSLARGIHREGSAYCGFWWIEIGGLLNTINDNEKITYELRRIVYGIWDYIKNSGKFEGVDNLLLDKVTSVAGKRESRRFVGDYILTQNDIEDKTYFNDAVCIGGWSMDVHARHGIYDKGPATYWHPNNGIYNLPFRALYSKNIANLLFAGRDISCTHIAMGSTRVMSTGGCTGQAVGTAAWLCKKHGVNPAALATEYTEILKDELQKDDQTIMGRPDKCTEELLHDLTVTASSVRKYENVSCESVLNSEKNYCIALPVKDRLNSVEIRVKNSSDEAQQLTVSVYGGRRPENYVPEMHLKDITVTIPADFDDWVTLAADLCAPEDKKVYLMVKQQESLSFYCNEEKLTGVVTFSWQENNELQKYPKAGLFKMQRLEQNICFRAVKPSQSIYEAENLINSYSRPYGMPNIWMSEEEGEQSIRLDYSKPKNIDEIQLVFNTQLEYDNFNEMMPDLVKAYRLEITTQDGKKEQIEVTDNYLRCARHKIQKSCVTSVKIVCLETYGSPRFQMYAVKLF